MIKCYCDICKKEIVRNIVSNRITQMDCNATGSIVFEIMAGYETLNLGEICPKCLIEAINSFWEI